MRARGGNTAPSVGTGPPGGINNSAPPSAPSVAMETSKREQCAALLRAGQTPKQIQQQLGVGHTFVYKIKSLVAMGRSLEIPVKEGRPRSVRTNRRINAVSTAVMQNPRRNIRALARRFQVSLTSMHRIVREDLDLKSRVVQSRPLLTPDVMQKRLERATRLLNRLKKEDSKRVRIFSDEKIFTTNAAVNRRNSRYLTDLPVEDVHPEIRVNAFAKNPGKVMMLGVLGSDGQKCPAIFVAAGERLDAAAYQDLLRRHVVPWLQRAYPDGNYVFQQDGAPCHTANSTKQFLEENMENYWPPSFWPPYSPDLNPMDYSVWSVLETKACCTTKPNVEALKASIRRQWAALPTSYVRRACASFRRRLELCIAADGGYFE